MKRFVLVDGYNVLLVGGRAAGAGGRDQLLRDCARYHRQFNARVVVVFDAAEGAGTDQDTPLPGVLVQYAPDADAAILARLERSRSPGEWLVVTDDEGLGRAVRQLGADVRSGDWFLGRTVRRRGGKPEPEPDADKPSRVTQEEVDYWLTQFDEPPPEDDW